LHNKIFDASHASLVFENTQLHRNITISRLFLLNYTRMIFSTNTLHVFMEAKSSMILTFRSFVPCCSHQLDHTTCPDLLLVIEARRYKRDQFQFTERSFAACNKYCHRQHLFAKQFEECLDFKTR